MSDKIISKELHANYKGFVLLRETPNGLRRVDDKTGVFSKEDASNIATRYNLHAELVEALEELAGDECKCPDNRPCSHCKARAILTKLKESSK